MTIRLPRAGNLPRLFLLALILLPQPSMASQAFLDLIIDIGDAIGDVSLAGGDRDCSAQAFNEVKTALRKGRLSGGGDWVEGDEETTLTGACPASKVEVIWFKGTGKLLVNARLGCDCTGRSPTDLERGHVQFIAPVTQTTRPDGITAYGIGPIGDIKVEALCCMSRRAEPQVTVFTNTGARKTPPPGATQSAPQSAPATSPRPAPNAAPQPAHPAAPAQPQPRPAPTAQPQPISWSEQNPCPECVQEKRILDSIAERLAQLDVEVQSTQEAIDTNIRKRLQTEHRIDDIDTRLDDEKGQGGESFDPNTGITVRSYDQGNGTVKVDTLGPNDELLDSYSYPRKSSQELIAERAGREAEVEVLEQEEARLRERLEAARQARSRAETDLEQARRALRDCIETRCGQSLGGPRAQVADAGLAEDLPPIVEETSSIATADINAGNRMAEQVVLDHAAPGTTPPMPEADGNWSADAQLEVGENPVVVTARDIATGQAQDPAPALPGCDGSAINQPLNLGAVSEYESLKKDLESAAEGLAQKALGSLFGGGGGISFGGGGMDIPDSGPSGPDTEDDPIEDDLKQTFTDPETDVSIKVGMQLEGDTLLISTELDEMPARGTLHTVVLEGGDCQVQTPKEQILYRVEQDWRLDLWWSHDRWVSGEHVLHEEGSSFETGTSDHGTFSAPTIGEAKAASGSGLAGVIPAWRRFGFASPLGGVEGMGSVFEISDREKRDLINLAVHVALQQGDQIRTVVFPLHVMMEAFLTRQVLAQMGYRFSLEKALGGEASTTGGGAAIPTQLPPEIGGPSPYGGGMQQIDPPSHPQPEPAESILEEIDEEIVIN